MRDLLQQIIDLFCPPVPVTPEGFVLDELKEKPWEKLLVFKKGGGGGSAPDPDPNIGKAALKNAELGEDWLEFAREQFTDQNKRQERTDALSRQVTEQQMGAMRQAQDWAKEDRSRWENTFQPIEDRFVKDAKNWDSEDRQNKVAAEAAADVRNQTAQAEASNRRAMAARGVDPRSGRYAGVERSTSLAGGLAAAGAQNQARNNVRTQGMGMRADAANLGRGLPSQAAGAAGLGINAGNAALGSNMAANSSWAQGNQIMGQGYGAAMQGYSNQANVLQGQYNSELQSWNANRQANAQESAGFWGGLGSLAGAAVMFSSEEYKEDKKPADGALDKVRDMPVEEWKYKDGIGDGGQHVGPYAEDFQKATGKGDGKTIPMQDLMGLNMKAMQELAEKVDEIAAGLGEMPKKRGKK